MYTNKSCYRKCAKIASQPREVGHVNLSKESFLGIQVYGHMQLALSIQEYAASQPAISPWRNDKWPKTVHQRIKINERP
jgi:hypothetical protein